MYIHIMFVHICMHVYIHIYIYIHVYDTGKVFIWSIDTIGMRDNERMNAKRDGMDEVMI